MAENPGVEPTQSKQPTTVERTSDCDFVVSRIINGPPSLVYRAWTEVEIFRHWWVPASYGLTLLSCEMDVRVGGTYRLVFAHEGSTIAFFGVYAEVTPPTRLAWTNDEGDSGVVLTTVTFTERDGRTEVVVHDRYPSKEALDAAIESGSTGGLPDSLDQLDDLLQDPARGAL